MINISAKRIAFGGVMAALSVVILYIASLLPTLKLTMCVVASAVVCVAMIKSGTKTALGVYAAASAVSLIISPDKAVALGYLLFLGNYPVIKAYIERLGKLKAEWAVKLIAFAVYAAAALIMLRLFFPDTAILPLPVPAVFVILIAVAAVYDVALSIFITEINKRFTKFI